MTTRTRSLLLLRHAKALALPPGFADASDHARALSARGRADAVALGRLLCAHAMLPELALVSTSRRTHETFDLLGLGDCGTRLSLCDSLYLASAGSLLETLHEQAGSATSVLLIGHNPGLHELALHLAAGSPELAQGFPTCTLAAFDIDCPWPELGQARSRLGCTLRP